jgi:YD repeat-containing protein
VGAGQKTKTTAWTCCGMDSVTDENGRVTKYEYNAYTHNLWKVHEDYAGLNYVTTYTYDEVGNLKTETNARSKVTTYTYDDADRKTRADYPDATYETWTYRDDGRVYTHTDGRGRITTYRYDADDRLAGSGSYVAINYPNDTDVQIVRDKDGLITSTVDASGTTTNVYYPSQWLKTMTVSAGTTKTLTYQYNGVGLPSRLTTPDSLNFDYTYNARNQLGTLTDPSSTQVSFTYDNGGRRTDVTRPGSTIHYGYNARDWITAVQNRAGGVTRYDASYYYNDGALWDHAGNPLKRVENFGGSDFTTTLRDYVPPVV